MDNKEIADVLRKAAEIMSTEWGSEPIDEMREYADALDPPYKVDRSLRGWVMVNTFNGEGIFWADLGGLRQFSSGVVCVTWDTAEKHRYKVTKLRILQPGQTAVGSALIREAFTLLRSARYDVSADKLEEILEVDELERMEENND